MIADLFLHSQELNEYSQYGNFSDTLLAFLFRVEYHDKFLDEIEIFQRLIDCLPHYIVKCGKCLKVFCEIIMRTTLPRV